MSNSLVAVTNSQDLIMQEYVQKQLDAISILFPQLEIVHVNENDSIMQRYARYPDRLPAFFILKNGSRKNILQAKVTDEQFINWVSSTCG